MNERNPQIDALKGFAIFLVIVGHIIFWTDQSNYDTNLIFNLIYTFHVPLFFFIGGYLVYNRFGPTTLIWIKKKFMGLIIPYIIYTIIYSYIRRGVSLSQITIESLVKNIFSFTKPDSAWFLPVLFESFVILTFIINIERSMKKKTFMLFLILFLFVLPLIPVNSVNSIPGGFQIAYYPIYVVIGYYVSKYKEYIFKEKYGQNLFLKYSFFMLGILLFPILFSIRTNSLFNSIYFKFIIAFAGIIFSYFTIKLISESKINSFFVLCGVYSLELYLFHLIFGFYSSQLNIPIWFGSGILKPNFE